MLVDDRKRIFGKINIFDLAIAAMLILAITLLSFFFIKDNNPSPATEKIKITFKAEEIPEVFSHISKGNQVRLQKSEFVFGTVSDAFINDMLYYGVNSEGKWIASPKPNYKSAVFVVESRGTYTDGKAMIGDVELLRGKSYSMVMGMTAYYAKVLSIEK